MTPTPLDSLFARFLKERKYLRNVSPRTIHWYEIVWSEFIRSATRSLTHPSDITLDDLQQYVYVLRERGVRAVTCNSRVRALNAVLRWMHERGDLPSRLHLRPPKAEQRLIETLPNESIRVLVNYRPPTWVTRSEQHRDGPRRGAKAFALWRVHALVCTLLDTGCRIQEVLDSRLDDYDFDDLLLTVIGKGDKQRRVPFSIDLRRILYRYVEQRERLGVPRTEALMFPEHHGGPWDQRNALRSFYVLQRRLGLKRVGFHRLRHTFATEYLRRGGDVVRLSRTLGHTQITTTMRYLHLLTEDLTLEHAKVSVLSTRR
jgi:integrase/recombinase XerD